MSTLTKFTVVSSKPNKTGGYVIKLSANLVAQAFGMTKVIKRTFYIGAMPQALATGLEIMEDLSKFDIVARPCAVVKHADGRVETMNVEDAQKQGIAHEIYMLKYLHVKAA